MPRRRISRITNNEWETYKNIVNDFIDLDSGKQPFLWLKKVEQPLAFGEDSGIIYVPMQLYGLFQYNYIRTWPSSRESISGELDTGNNVLYISANLLRSNNLLDEYGYWDYNWSEDRFVLNGKVYKPSGDTQVAQAKDEALLFFVILQREDPEETQKILNSYAGSVAKVVSNEGTWILDASGQKVSNFCHLPLKVTGKPNIPAVKTKDGVIIGNVSK